MQKFPSFYRQGVDDVLSFKYLKDYRWDTITDEKGKVKNHTVYIGPLYRWNPQESAPNKWESIILTVLAAVLFVGSLWGYSQLSRIWYVVVPFSCTLFVLLAWARACMLLLKCPEIFPREHKEHMLDHRKGGGAAGMLLAAFTLTAAVVTALSSKLRLSEWDICFLAAVTLSFVIYLYDFRKTVKVKVIELPNPEAEKWTEK